VEIARVDCLAAYAGWRIHDFVKVTMADGLIGWSEFSRAFGVPGVGDAIQHISEQLLGRDPRSSETSTLLRELAQRSPVAYQACGALQNALLDVRARALGIPVHQLLGTQVRDQIRLYWAHCGTYRASHADLMRKPRVARVEDFVNLGREVVERGYTALKTNPLVFGEGWACRYSGGAWQVDWLRQQLAALRNGAGSDMDIMLDLGSKFSAERVIEIARAIEPYHPLWLEIEFSDAATLRRIAQATSVRIAGGERLRSAEYQDVLGSAAVEVPVVDLLFNGVTESLEIPKLCAAHGKTIAVHNCYSPLATLMAAAFCAVVPNLYILEHDVDAVSWENDFVTVAPDIQRGYLCVPTGPGWGSEVNEAAVRAHPLEGGA
jgi:L-alanine-DL-glutamate epimerase-like enolase superfamily enzyme